MPYFESYPPFLKDQAQDFDSIDQETLKIITNQQIMDRNSSKPNQYQQKENKKKKDLGKPIYFWVSYQDDPKEEKTKYSNGDSLLERSNRFAL